MSTDIFRIYCDSCGSKLNARTDLIGQTRSCPKCKAPILIQRPDGSTAQSGQTAQADPNATPIIVNVPSITDIPRGPTLDEGVGRIENLPERLQVGNRYLVLGVDRIVALWESGKGWQVNVGNGFAPARKNIAAIPDQGSFVLVELIVDTVPGALSGGGGPTGLHAFKISSRGALTSLYRDEGEILGRVDAPAELSKFQKNLLLGYLRQHFMHESLAGSGALLEALSM